MNAIVSLGRVAVAAVLVLAAGLLHAEEGRLYTPGPFDRINISGVAKVELSQGLRDQVFVAGGEDAQRNVRLTLSNGRLVVETHDGWKFWRNDPVLLKMQVRELSQLVISGASDIVAAQPIKADALRVSISGQGQVRLAALQAAQLRFDISGAGEGEVAGRVDELQLRISGKGKVAADRLRAAVGAVVISGIGGADVWVTDELRITVSGIGNVSYWGSPRVVRSTSGLADVSARGDKHP